jgi:DNA-binding winged helix-turn-helix (wHTH) protein/TolB-like protein
MAIKEGSTSGQTSAQGVRRHYYEFGPYRLDVLNQQLRRAGAPVAITPKTLDLLLVLLRHRDRVVSKTELMGHLWGDTAVEEANLTQQVFTLRRILGEDAAGATYIETVPRRGYRLAADVREVTEEPPAKPAGPIDVAGAVEPDDGARAARGGPGGRPAVRAILALALLAAAAGVLTAWKYWPVEPHDGPVMVAVLPFENLSGSAARAGQGLDFADSLAVGIPDAIITRLSSARQFRVRPTSAVARYYGRSIDVQEIGQRLAAEYVLVGTIRAAERVRVSVQLVRTTDGSPVWGRQYDSARADLLGIEDSVADAIADALRIRLSDAERERFYRRYTRNGAAYERYLMGRALLRSVTERDALKAIAEFEAARNLDPDFALAYAGLATAAAQLRVRFPSKTGDDIWDARARQEAGRALEIDPELAEAHVAIAAVHRFQEYDWDTVIRESRRALDLNPGLDMPHLYLAVAYFHIGLLEEAEAEVRAAREQNPENRVERMEILGAASLFAGRTTEAAGHLSQAHELTDSRIVTYLFGWTLFYLGERPRAEALLETMIDDEGLLPGNARATLAAFRAARGATVDARALAARVAAEPELNHHAAYGLGAVHAQLGDPAVALRWLAQAATTGFPCYPWYERDPLLDPVRDDPRFTEFMKELRQSWEDARGKYTGRTG